jgi:hypothetical protein
MRRLMTAEPWPTAPNGGSARFAQVEGRSLYVSGRGRSPGSRLWMPFDAWEGTERNQGLGVAECPDCGRQVGIMHDGRLRTHGHRRGRCHGSGYAAEPSARPLESRR